MLRRLAARPGRSRERVGPEGLSADKSPERTFSRTAKTLHGDAMCERTATRHRVPGRRAFVRPPRQSTGCVQV
eukprot:724957-Prymnesium_polylepis.1